MFDLGVGDGVEKPIATIAKRKNIVDKILKEFPEQRRLISSVLRDYESYLAEQNAGVTVCHSNVQGLEQLEEDGEWYDWYTDEYDSIRDLERDYNFQTFIDM